MSIYKTLCVLVQPQSILLLFLKISLLEMLIAVGNEHLKMSPFLVLNSFYIPKIHYLSCES